MAVTSIKRIGDGQGGNHRGPSDSSITLVYRVITDNPLDTPSEIRPALPFKWGDALGTTGLICQGESYDFQNKGPSQSVWHVSLEFSTLQIEQTELEKVQELNPLDRRARVTVRSVRYGELRITDKNGQVKRTSAGEIYEAKEVDATRYTIHVKKNYLAIPSFIWEYQDRLNFDTITVKGRVLEPETVKFGEIMVPELQVENNVQFYPIEFELDYRSDGWKDKRVDAGFYFLDAANGDAYTRIMVVNEDGDSEPAEVPQWLDGMGGKLTNPDPGDEVINEFDDYKTADFSILPLNEG